MDLKAAEQLARQKVQVICPELAVVTPSVSKRRRYTPSPAVLSRLNINSVPAGAPGDDDEYTFTFAAELRDSTGQREPRVARVTVNMRSGVVKASASK